MQPKRLKAVHTSKHQIKRDEYTWNSKLNQNQRPFSSRFSSSAKSAIDTYHGFYNVKNLTATKTRAHPHLATYSSAFVPNKHSSQQENSKYQQAQLNTLREISDKELLEAFANQIVLFSPENRPPEWFEGQVKRMQEIASLGNEIEHKANEPEKEQAQIKTFRFPSNLRRIGKSAR